jgi:hypothetical protein
MSMTPARPTLSEALNTRTFHFPVGPEGIAGTGLEIR